MNSTFRLKIREMLLQKIREQDENIYLLAESKNFVAEKTDYARYALYDYPQAEDTVSDRQKSFDENLFNVIRVQQLQIETLYNIVELLLQTCHVQDVFDDRQKIENYIDHISKEYLHQQKTNRKWRVAFFTPLPPLKNGIADYSEAILQKLKDIVDVELFIADDYMPTDPNILDHFVIHNHREYPSLRYHFDTVIYQIGNNPDHVYMLNYALDYPGIVELHEFGLSCIYYLAPPDIQERSKEACFSVQYLYQNETNPMNKYFLDQASLIIAHNRYTKEKILAQNKLARVKELKHFAYQDSVSGDIEKLKQRYGLEGKFLIATFGFATQAKMLEPSLLAFSELCKNNPDQDLMFLIAGEVSENLIDRIQLLIKELNIKDHVRILNYMELNVFEDYLQMVDIAANLRWPYGGESSGTVARLLAKGKPMLVTNVGSFSEIPDDACIKIDVYTKKDLWKHGYNAFVKETLPYWKEIYQRLNGLLHDSEQRKQIGRNAVRYVEEELNLDAIIEKYYSIINQECHRTAMLRDLTYRAAQFICMNSFIDVQKATEYAVDLIAKHVEEAFAGDSEINE